MQIKETKKENGCPRGKSHAVYNATLRTIGSENMIFSRHPEPCPEPFGGVYTECIECAQDRVLRREPVRNLN